MCPSFDPAIAFTDFKPQPMKKLSQFNRSQQGGFTIIELMIALVLSLVVVGGAISIYLNNQASFRTNDNLAKIQENARFAFELLSRDIREAGSNPCGVKAVASTIRVSGAPTWWADWNNGTLVGYGGTQTVPTLAVGTTASSRVSNTDAIIVLRSAMNDSDLMTIQSHDPVATTIYVNTLTGAASPGEVILVCDSTSGAIVAVAGQGSSPPSIDYDKLVASTNCTDNLGYPLPDDCTGATTKTFQVGGVVASLAPAIWYIGNNGNGGTSLYKRVVDDTGTIQSLEMVPNIQNMQLQYLTRSRSLTTNDLATTWVSATDSKFDSANGAWRDLTVGGIDKNDNEVIAVRVTLTLSSPDNQLIEGVAVTRTMVGVIKIRTRETKESI
jgi:type IV pilus assembly protein PilW